MPTTRLKNMLYRVALPLKAPSVKGKLSHTCHGKKTDLSSYERILVNHHVHGASLYLASGSDVFSRIDTSVPQHTADSSTLFRVASVTKMATSLITLRLVDEGAFTLDTSVADLLHLPSLSGITVRQLLSHTSGLRDVPQTEMALLKGQTLQEVLDFKGVRTSEKSFAYCNLAFGILGSVMETVTEKSLRDVFADMLLRPASMDGTIDASVLEENQIMLCTRVLPYHPEHSLRKTQLGSVPLDKPDPVHHFGHTAGALYTNAESLDHMLEIIRTGSYNGHRFLSPHLLKEMKRIQSHYGRRSPTLHYGLGLLMIQDPRMSSHTLYGHQGFAYGCVDGVFYEDETERRVIFLNGGCSEARTGMLADSNRDILQFGIREMKTWQP